MLLMPFAGFTLTFSILPGYLPVVLAKPSITEKTLHTKPHIHGASLVFFPPQIVGRISASDVDQQRQGKAQLTASRFRNSSNTTTCLPTLADCTGANYIKWADGMC